MVWKNDLRAIRDEQVAIHLYTARPQRSDFFQEGQRVEDHSVANHIHATGAENASGHQLQGKRPERPSCILTRCRNSLKSRPLPVDWTSVSPAMRSNRCGLAPGNSL